MRKSTVKRGVKLLIWGLLLVITAFFYHEEPARILALSPGSEVSFIMFGLFWGGVLACIGSVIAGYGLMRAPLAGTVEPALKGVLLLFISLLVLFVWLLINESTVKSPPRLRPGQSITI